MDIAEKDKIICHVFIQWLASVGALKEYLDCFAAHRPRWEGNIFPTIRGSFGWYDSPSGILYWNTKQEEWSKLLPIIKQQLNE